MASLACHESLHSGIRVAARVYPCSPSRVICARERSLRCEGNDLMNLLWCGSISLLGKGHLDTDAAWRSSQSCVCCCPISVFLSNVIYQSVLLWYHYTWSINAICFGICSIFCCFTLFDHQREYAMEPLMRVLRRKLFNCYSCHSIHLLFLHSLHFSFHSFLFPCLFSFLLPSFRFSSSPLPYFPFSLPPSLLPLPLPSSLLPAPSLF